MKFPLNNVLRNFYYPQLVSFKENDKFRKLSTHVGGKNKNLQNWKHHLHNNYISRHYNVLMYYEDKREYKRYFSSFMKNVIEQVKKDMKENKQYQEALRELKEKTEIDEKTTKIKNKIEENIKLWKRIKQKNVEAIKLIYTDIHTFITYSFENILILKFSKNAAINFYYLLQKWVINGADKINQLKQKWDDNSAFIQLDKWRQEMEMKRHKKKVEKQMNKLAEENETAHKEMDKTIGEKQQKQGEETGMQEGEEEEEEEPPETIRNELILAQESAWDRFGSKLKDMPFLNNFFENPLWGKIFGETELAAALREMKTRDENFKLSELIYLFEYVISKHIVESYLLGDEQTLKLHCGAAAFNSLNASITERKKKKVNLDTNVLIYKNHELKGAQRIEESFPWFIFTFHTQQINCLRNQNDEIIEGKIDDIREVVYTVALSKHPKPETEGLLYPYIIREFAIIGNTPSW